MANPEHIDRLLQGAEAWNQWGWENIRIKPDLSGADLSGADLSGTNLSSADLSGADLSSADLRGVDIDFANLSKANLSKANLSGTNLNFANLSGANLSGANLSRARLGAVNLSKADLGEANLSAADLTSANLSKANLSKANLSAAFLSEADLSGANLSGANLRTIQALYTNFQAATLTGICIEDWHINSRTNLQDVACEYIFTEYDEKKYQFTDRRPHDPDQIFAPGEFTKRYQIVLETVELFFNDGIDWKAFLASLQDLKTQYGDDLNIQGIEKKAGSSFIVRLEVPSDADRGAVERDVKVLYESNLRILEAKYHAELQAKDEQIEIYKQKSADILELAKLAASRPINVENEILVEQQSNSETYNTTVHGPVGNFASKMQDNAAQHATQNIGATLDEVATLIRSMRGIAESFPQVQRTEAIDHLEEIETELKQPPEQRKKNRVKAALLALVGIATAISGAVAGANEFATQVQELSDKLGIPLPIEQVQPQQSDTVDVRAVEQE